MYEFQPPIINVIAKPPRVHVPAPIQEHEAYFHGYSASAMQFSGLASDFSALSTTKSVNLWALSVQCIEEMADIVKSTQSLWLCASVEVLYIGGLKWRLVSGMK